MRIERMLHKDIDPFLKIAMEEGWICERDELQFLLDSWPHGAFVARGELGASLGFITSIAYSNSGWIGNLIVDMQSRRKGVGSLLMKQCLDSLVSSGARTVWLTASPSGAPLYERFGFRAIDRIARWKLEGAIPPDRSGTLSEEAVTELVRHDSCGWGDERGLVCREAVRLGEVIPGAGASLVVRSISTGTLIGPWVGESPLAAASLIDSAINRGLGPGLTIADVPVANNHAGEMLSKYSFLPCSETVLMYLGEVPDYRPELIFSLATPGSIG